MTITKKKCLTAADAPMVAYKAVGSCRVVDGIKEQIYDRFLFNGYTGVHITGDSVHVYNKSLTAAVWLHIGLLWVYLLVSKARAFQG